MARLPRLSGRELAAALTTLYLRVNAFAHSVLGTPGSENLTGGQLAALWNEAYRELGALAPAADALGAATTSPTRRDFAGFPIFRLCVPRMKVAIDLLLVAVEVVVKHPGPEAMEFLAEAVSTASRQFEGLVRACQEVIDVGLSHWENPHPELRDLVEGFDSEVVPLYQRGLTLLAPHG